MSRRLLAAVAAAALTFGLAACGEGGDGPVTTPPPKIDVGQGDGASDGGGDAPSDGGGEADDGDGSTEAAPDIPAPDPADFPGMDEQTPEGAEQAFKYFWAVAIWGHQTGDAGPLREVSSEDCEPCAEMRKDIEEIGDKRAYWSSTSVEHVTSNRNDPVGDFEYVFSYTFTVAAHTEPSLDGESSSEIPERKMGAAGALVWDGDRWKVADVSSAEADSEES